MGNFVAHYLIAGPPGDVCGPLCSLPEACLGKGDLENLARCLPFGGQQSIGGSVRHVVSLSEIVRGTKAQQRGQGLACWKGRPDTWKFWVMLDGPLVQLK